MSRRIVPSGAASRHSTVATLSGDRSSDAHIMTEISGAIKFGAPMYNRGETAQCAELYQVTMKNMLRSKATVQDAKVRDRFEAALQEAEKCEMPNEKAWALRRGFDDVAEILQNKYRAQPQILTPRDIPEKATKVLWDFSADVNSAWRTLNDSIMGGISDMAIEWKDECAEFKGTVRLDYNGGFASARARRQIDIAAFDGFYLDVRCSTPDKVFLLLVKDYECTSTQVNFKAPFAATEEWGRIYVPFEALTPEMRGRTVQRGPLDTSNLQEIGLMIIKGVGENQTGQFQLDVRAIGAYSES